MAKPKKKWGERKVKLSAEEARQLARKEFAPDWHGHQPLFGAIRLPAGVGLFPLDPEFQNRNWTIVFIDPSSVHSDPMLDYCKEIHRRYEGLNVGMVVILRSSLKVFSQEDAIQYLIRHHSIKFPVVIDRAGLLSAAFGVTELPRVLLYSLGKKNFDKSVDQLASFEVELQPFLRKTDPGLPLLPAFDVNSEVTAKCKSIELGTRLSPQAIPPEVKLSGNWKREEEYIFSDDPKATLSLTLQGTGFAMVARSIGRVAAPAKVMVQVQGEPARSSEAGKDLSFDHDGSSRVRILVPALYQVLTQLVSGVEVLLSFPEAPATPVAIYGLRVRE